MVRCLPFDSILDYDKMLRPEEIPEYLDFARRLLAMRVNSLILFSQYASGGSLFERCLSHAEPVERFAQFMDRFGVSIRLALHYTSPDESGHYVTLCSYSDHIREQWQDFVARMAVTMPTVRNFRLRGAGEEAPGPHEDDCDRCAATPLRNDPRYQFIFNRMPLTDAYAAELMAEKRVATGHMKGNYILYSARKIVYTVVNGTESTTRNQANERQIRRHNQHFRVL